jgi:DNA-binding LacI/PurR family transcriptional regulator
MARADGFEQGLAEHGAPPDKTLRFEGSYLAPSGREAVSWLLDKHGAKLPSAIFFANYLMASGALTEFYDHGVRVPEDIALAVFDQLPQLEYVRPKLTRVGNSPTALARRATEMLIERLTGKFEGPPRTEIIRCELTPYDTA